MNVYTLQAYSPRVFKSVFGDSSWNLQTSSLVFIGSQIMRKSVIDRRLYSEEKISFPSFRSCFCVKEEWICSTKDKHFASCFGCLSPQQIPERGKSMTTETSLHSNKKMQLPHKEHLAAFFSDPVKTVITKTSGTKSSTWGWIVSWEEDHSFLLFYLAGDEAYILEWRKPVFYSDM
jgi:hypothetical protein